MPKKGANRTIPTLINMFRRYNQKIWVDTNPSSSLLLLPLLLILRPHHLSPHIVSTQNTNQHDTTIILPPLTLTSTSCIQAYHSLLLFYRGNKTIFVGSVVITLHIYLTWKLLESKRRGEYQRWIGEFKTPPPSKSSMNQVQAAWCIDNYSSS